MSAGPFRVPAERSPGTSLNREQRVRFSFDGESYEGFRGDSLASALLANGVRTISRSFKFHRPRGVYASGIEEPNAFVQTGTGATSVPSERAPLVELSEGLQAESLSRRGFDPWRVLDFTARLWAAGFYNRTFIWPSWHSYEGIIRRMAGFGQAPAGSDPDRYEGRNLHCDVLVIGGGEAGLEAAYEAARGGARVVLVEQGSELGGRSSWNGAAKPGQSSKEWAQRLANVQILTRTTAVGYYEQDVVALVERVADAQKRPGVPRERYWIARAKRVVIATGAIEQ
ncbi:FAD-dependent oxidoreductase, partial [Steroidobacter sp.]|uniref:FAD-dependent oxidoreductase n=1 Tax=Steroidobacter sp. TaxID=1978227 RepID=UPI001A599726